MDLNLFLKTLSSKKLLTNYVGKTDPHRLGLSLIGKSSYVLYFLTQID